MRIDNSTPVVVLRSPRNTALGVARSLGRLGVPVYAVDSDRMTPAFFSRFCRGHFFWNIDRRPSAEVIDFLKGVASKIGARPILIPATDSAAVFVCDHGPDLGESFLLPKQPVGLAGALNDKRRMYYLAKTHNIPTAETVFPRNRGDVARFLETARFPVMVKATHSTRMSELIGKRMVVVQNARELRSQYEAVGDPEELGLMFQEYIPGGDDTIWMFNGYFNSNSDCMIGFTGRKLREYPVHTGPTSLGVCLPNAIVEEQTKRFMKALGYQGILDIGYRFDARDGQYKVLDVNPRVGATFRLFVADNGMDVVRALYLDITGQPVPAAVTPSGRKWIIEDLDLFASLRYIREGELTLGGWLRSLSGIRECAGFAWDDPIPAFVMGLLDMRGGLESITRRYVHKRRLRAVSAAKA